jgi:CBS-domain-containing membrane protein
MRVADSMQTVSTEATIGEVVQGQLVGVISQSDIVHAVARVAMPAGA